MSCVPSDARPVVAGPIGREGAFELEPPRGGCEDAQPLFRRREIRAREPCRGDGAVQLGQELLALDTIHAEGRRRFVESLSTYARQFLGLRDRPPFDRIEGLGPPVAVEARVGGSSRARPWRPRPSCTTSSGCSTPRAGTLDALEHGETLKASDAAGIGRRVLKAVGADEAGLWVLAPLAGTLPREPLNEPRPWSACGPSGWRPASPGSSRTARRSGSRRVSEASRTPASWIWWSTGSSSLPASARDRGGRRAGVCRRTGPGEHPHQGRGAPRSSTRGACTQCGFQLEGASSRGTSRSTHVGACPDCHGLGSRWTCDADLLVADPEKPLREEG